MAAIRSQAFILRRKKGAEALSDAVSFAGRQPAIVRCRHGARLQLGEKTMRGRIYALLAGASLTLAGMTVPAAADWQYTRWGMSPEQVVAASNGAVRLGPPPQGKTYDKLTGRALGNHEADGATFHAFFHFDAANGLAKVALERNSGTACAALQGGLAAQYGQPVKSTRNNFATIDEWRDAVRGNVVRYVLVGDLPCTITYDRL
jgi:hypothetical protein